MRLVVLMFVVAIMCLVILLCIVVIYVQLYNMYVYMCSWHASCALAGNRLFIHGGYNGSVVLADSFIFDLGKLKLLKIKLQFL